jgi:hypothetical protein
MTTNANLLPREHRFYIELIHMLSGLYKDLDKGRVELLSDASYKYFTFLLSLDAFIDNTESKSRQLETFLYALKDLEVSIRELSSLYPAGDSTFWNTFDASKEQYFKTLMYEKGISKEKPDIDEALFLKLAVGKSVMCHNAVYSLQELARNNDYEKHLIKCINEIHIAFQYLDDIDDFKKDIQEEQWTYPQSQVRGFLIEKSIAVDNPTDLYKYLFISGIAEQNIHKAMAHYGQAIHIAEGLNLQSLVKYINEQIKNTEFYLSEIHYLFEKTRVKSGKSNQTVSENTVKQAIDTALEYVKINQNEDFSWSDFMTSAGAGKAWITGYIGMQLAEYFKEDLSVKNAVKAITQNPEKFLSYNHSIFQDGDSTSFIIGLLSCYGIENSSLYHKWETFLTSGGGWLTYNQEEPLRKRLDLAEDIPVTAWFHPQNCVTAAAAYILVAKNDPKLKNTLDFLKKAVNKNGYWDSYWWTSPVYATAYAVLATLKRDTALAGKGAAFLATSQHNDGNWINPFTDKPNAFYTALALKALLVYDAKHYSSAIEKGINWLLKNQTTDGSWQTDRILQIPATNVPNPTTVRHWRSSSFGVNCVTDDHNRVFSTATVLNCLCTYKAQVQC